MGEVLKVIRKKNQVVVRGCNMKFRHVSMINPDGDVTDRLIKEFPLHVSNVLLVDPEL
jgi:ribosomal protein L24